MSQQPGDMKLKITCECGCGFTTTLEGQFPMTLANSAYYCALQPDPDCGCRVCTDAIQHNEILTATFTTHPELLPQDCMRRDIGPLSDYVPNSINCQCHGDVECNYCTGNEEAFV